MKIDPSKIQIRRDEINFMKKIYAEDQVMYNDLQNDNIKLVKQLEELDKEYQLITRNIEIQRDLLIKEKNKNGELKVIVD